MHEKFDILIIGGGFAGVRFAQEAVKKGLSVALISDKDYFEYYPAMYRIVTGAPESTSAIPLKHTRYYEDIAYIIDQVITIELNQKTATCRSGKVYQCEHLVLALGVTNSYFGIPGMKEYSFGFKSIETAKHLHKRVRDLFETKKDVDVEEQMAAFHFVIAGGGVSGVELAGELFYDVKKLAKKNAVPFSRVSIDIVESNPTLVPTLPVRAQKAITDRLVRFGIHVLCNRRVTESKAWTVHLSDMTIAAQTVIWAAGVAPNSLLVNTVALPLTQKKRIQVNEHLVVDGYTHVYAIGDCADTLFSGLAQTAEKHGVYLAKYISAQKKNTLCAPFVQKNIAYCVPVGKWWGVFIYNNTVYTGFLPWALRFIIDAKFYYTLLPLRRVLKIFRDVYTKK